MDSTLLETAARNSYVREVQGSYAGSPPMEGNHPLIGNMKRN